MKTNKFTIHITFLLLVLLWTTDSQAQNYSECLKSDLGNIKKQVKKNYNKNTCSKIKIRSFHISKDDSCIGMFFAVKPQKTKGWNDLIPILKIDNEILLNYFYYEGEARLNKIEVYLIKKKEILEKLKNHFDNETFAKLIKDFDYGIQKEPSTRIHLR